MKKIAAAILLVLFFTSASAQSKLGYGEGVIVKKNGDSIRCLIELAFSYQNRVYFKVPESTEPLSLKTKEVRNLIFPHKFIEAVQIGKQEKLMTRMVEGTIHLYSYVAGQDAQVAPDFTVPIGQTRYVVKKDGSVKELQEKTFEADMQSLLQNCQAVLNKLKDRTYGYQDIERIITEYNSCGK